MLVVQACDDPYGTLDQVERIDRHVPGRVDRLVLEEGGHAPHLRCADQVVETVGAWVEGLG